MVNPGPLRKAPGDPRPYLETTGSDRLLCRVIDESTSRPRSVERTAVIGLPVALGRTEGEDERFVETAMRSCSDTGTFARRPRENQPHASRVPFARPPRRHPRRAARPGARRGQGPLHQVRVSHPHAGRSPAVHRRLRPQGRLRQRTRSCSTGRPTRSPPMAPTSTGRTSARARSSPRPGTSSPTRTSGAGSGRRGSTSTSARTTRPRRARRSTRVRIPMTRSRGCSSTSPTTTGRSASPASRTPGSTPSAG